MDLRDAVNRFAHLVTAAYAYEFPDARDIRVLENDDGDVLVAAVVSMVGSGAGHSWDECLAVCRGWGKNLDKEDLYLLDFPRDPDKEKTNPSGIPLKNFIRIREIGCQPFDNTMSFSLDSEGGGITMAFKESSLVDAINRPPLPTTTELPG